MKWLCLSVLCCTDAFGTYNMSQGIKVFCMSPFSAFLKHDYGFGGNTSSNAIVVTQQNKSFTM